tara:strand:+ start:43 stop:735 length:693 start_codon:yes stop_codon:yes gene_type:complete
MAISLNEPLGKYFRVKHFIYSSTAKTEGTNNMLGVDGNPNATKALANAKALFENCVDPLVDKYPDLIITSGYRCKKLNDVDFPKYGYKASKSSQHKRAQAVDVQVPGAATLDIFNWCVNNIDYDQIIWEFPEKGNKSWVHLSYKTSGNQRKRTIATKRKDYHDNYSTMDTTFSSSGTYQHGIDTARFTKLPTPIQPITLDSIPVSELSLSEISLPITIGGDNSLGEFFTE